MRTKKCETFIFNVLFLFDLSHNVLNYVHFRLPENFFFYSIIHCSSKVWDYSFLKKFLMLTNAASI